MISLAPVITAIAAVVFVSCLLCRAFRQRQPSKVASGGRHCREPKQRPSPVLLYALTTVGTHGLGFVRENEPA
ncbi:hypothetical protein SAMN05192558_10469 [Actinokineospora alba]|uniref:Uncharacterized protein n=1 Tax=Actinokineospora alba TaxID=504798 RepID=A0A1H0LAW1_9PSEU|nr:hypothetical protein [Actinokineospora alba]TDP67251.1 hypothetical protein C8E96_2788 [Actinokineospora alba]SDJ02784.1 hypothetical protein SAMN05421871_109228 [Actinokineospora alba]SDO65121.1 hypothetical protein SAMN05192558_10469 [Actinokineospora alba]